MKYRPSYAQVRTYRKSHGGDDCGHCGHNIPQGAVAADLGQETFHADCAQESLDMEG